MITQFPQNLDCIIIGAGAAGLSAARRLQQKRFTCVVVEASGRTGGRLWTESNSFSVPVDHGASWMSGADKNSLVPIAQRAGLTLVDDTESPDALFVGDRPATKKEEKALDRAFRKIEKALTKSGKKKTTRAASEVIPNDLPFAAEAQSWLGPMDHGVDFQDFSPIDYWEQAEDQPSFLVREGYGSIVPSLAADISVSLDTKVTKVDWSGSGVVVETSRGNINARTCLVTVSAGVLRKGGIQFSPELPVENQEGIAGVDMGLLVKVPLLFDGARLGLEDGTWVTYALPQTTPTRACFFVAWPCGHDYLFGNIGGSLGWELSKAGPEAAINFALGELSSIFGSDARKHFVKGLITNWANDPLFHGAYSVQKPGHRNARKKLGRAVGDRIFFAGEAVGGARSALANGAYDSGRKAAKKIMKVLKTPR